MLQIAGEANINPRPSQLPPYDGWRGVRSKTIEFCKHMNRRRYILIALLVAVIFPYTQMAVALAPALAGIHQLTDGAMHHDDRVVAAVRQKRQNLGRATHISGHSGLGDNNASPSVPFPGYHDCGQDLGMCTAITPEPLEGYRGVAHRSFKLPPLQYFSDFLPSLIPHPPKTVS